MSHVGDRVIRAGSFLDIEIVVKRQQIAQNFVFRGIMIGWPFESIGHRCTANYPLALYHVVHKVVAISETRRNTTCKKRNVGAADL